MYEYVPLLSEEQAALEKLHVFNVQVIVPETFLCLLKDYLEPRNGALQ